MRNLRCRQASAQRLSILLLRDALVPPALRRCMVVGAGGVPRFWATIHELTQMSALAKSSRRTALAGIDTFLPACRRDARRRCARPTAFWRHRCATPSVSIVICNTPVARIRTPGLPSALEAFLRAFPWGEESGANRPQPAQMPRDAGRGVPPPMGSDRQHHGRP